MSTDNVRLQFFIAAVVSPSDPKTTVVQIQRVRTLDEDTWFSFPESSNSPSSHSKLVELSSMKSTIKALKSRGQSRNVIVGFPKEVYKLYTDEDGNFVFGDFMLAETKFRKSDSLSEVGELIQSISSLTTKEESVKSVLKYFLIEKFSVKSKNVELWCLNFERESERLEISGSRQIEVFKSCLEPDLLDWFFVCQNKIGISADWSVWKSNLIATFGDISWYPVAYAFNFKFLAGSYIDYTIKKEKLIIELNKGLTPATILDLIIVGLPNHIIKTLNKTQVKTIDR